MANLYYNNAFDTAWDTLGNWWNDDIFTDPALALPATGDTVYLSVGMTSGPSTAVTLAHIYVNAGIVNFTGAVGNATFSGPSVNNEGTITGNATFDDYSINYYGTVSGNATFNDYSYNYSGTVSGSAAFSLTSAVIQITNSDYGTYGSVTIQSGTSGGGDNTIARLLDLPWFINL